MTVDFEYLSVPRGDRKVYDLAEDYFVARLTARFRPKGYDCYREYEYAGGSKFMPTAATLTHSDPVRSLILHMLQGADGAPGFRFPKPKKTSEGELKEGGFQKPDFLAFRTNDGVVGEVGTAEMRAEKVKQLNARLVDLKSLVEQKLKEQSYESVGRRIPWNGMGWRAADYHPEEGPVLIPVDEDRLISTEPTFEPATNGIYLYQLLRYRRHQLPIGSAIALPRFTSEVQQQLREAWRRYQQPAGAKSTQDAKPSPRQARWLDGWPALRRELLQAVVAVGVAAVVVAAVAVVVASLGVAAAAVAVLVAGFAAALASGLNDASRPRLA